MVESLDLMLEIDLKEENKKKKKLGGGGFKPAIDQGKGKQIEGQGKESKPGGGCFICGRLHYTRECLKKEIFNVILVDDCEWKETVTHINPVDVLNRLVVKLKELVDECNLVQKDLVLLDTPNPNTLKRKKNTPKQINNNL